MILKYEKEFDVSISIAKHKFKKEIRSNSQLPTDVKTSDEIPDESEYYKAKRDESFEIFNLKYNNFSISISSICCRTPNAEHLMLECHEHNYVQFFEFLDYIEKTNLKKKTTFYKLILTLKEEESLSYNDYKKRIKRERKLGRTDEINALIKYYKKMEILLAKKENNKNDFVESWLKCFPHKRFLRNIVVRVTDGITNIRVYDFMCPCRYILLNCNLSDIYAGSSAFRNVALYEIRHTLINC
ncbi:hypothetical protein U3516DRAFT_732809 [Neocallimastix sp. 'constans']